MALKAITFKLDENRIEMLKAACEAAGMKQAEFISQAIDNMVDDLANVKSGGMNLKIRSPYMYAPLTDNQRLDIVTFINEMVYEYGKISRNKLDFGFNEIKKFVEYRLNVDNDKREREGFVDAFYKYLEIQKILEKGGKDHE